MTILTKTHLAMDLKPLDRWRSDVEMFSDVQPRMTWSFWILCHVNGLFLTDPVRPTESSNVGRGPPNGSLGKW